MNPTTLTATYLRRKSWVERVRKTWNYVTMYGDRVYGADSWHEYLGRSIAQEIEFHRDNHPEMSALRHIIVRQLPTLTACEMIEEYDL